MHCPIIAPPKKKILKIKFFFWLRHVYLLINNIFWKFCYSKIIRKGVHNCPAFYISSVQHCPMDRGARCPENSGKSGILIAYNSGVRNFHNYVCLEQDKSPSSQVIEDVSKALFSAHLCKSIYNLHYSFIKI